jgi:GrpB-like predicted nucleotidyltransferase (UPF0157 family)
MDEPKETGVIGGPEKRDITVLAYNPEWPQKFQKHEGIIRSALGDTALQIEHIGSTAVPGLAAKPIIDVLVVVPDSSDESFYLPQLEEVGYVLRVREPDFHEHRMMRTPEKDVHIHIFSPGSSEVERYLLFRDRLRQDPKARNRYEKVKRELATHAWSDMNAYADAKTKIIEKIIKSARVDSE